MKSVRSEIEQSGDIVEDVPVECNHPSAHILLAFVRSSSNADHRTHLAIPSNARRTSQPVMSELLAPDGRPNLLHDDLVAGAEGSCCRGAKERAEGEHGRAKEADLREEDVVSAIGGSREPRAKAHLDSSVSAHSQATALATKVIAHATDEAKFALVAWDTPAPRRVGMRIMQLGEGGMDVAYSVH